MIYALCRILVKCRDLRIFPGKKIRIPGTKNYYAGLPPPIDFFMYFSWKMGSKMEPKSMPKSYSNDLGRPKGRPGPIVNVFRSEKDGKRGAPKSMQKNDAEKKGPVE